jgi:arylsulfatase
MSESNTMRTIWVRALPLVIVGLVTFSVGRFGVDEPIVQVEESTAPNRPVFDPKVQGLSEQPNIILVTVDTLRGDHLGAYGYERDTSPWLDSLAENGVVAEQAFGGSSWTVPSMATIFTGLYPVQHGVERGLVVSGNITEQPVLSDEHFTLAEKLKEAGYTTFGIATNRHLSRLQGFAQGFDYFVNEGFVNGHFVHDVVTDWASEIQAASPYFLWLHFFDPHDRYRARRPWVEEFDLAAAMANPEIATQDARERDRRLRYWSEKVISQIRNSELAKEKVALETLKVLYDSEIRYSDDWIQKSLNALNIAPDTVIVFTSDHGEEFMDHGDFGHRTTLYNEQVAVPLVISAPGRIPAGKRLKEPVTLVDLPATLLEIASGKVPAVGENEARSLMPVLRGEASVEPRPLLMSTRRAGELLVGVVDGDLKLIRNQKQKTNELYDLTEDWGEKNDLAASRPDDVAALLKKMRTRRESFPKFAASSVKEVLSDDDLEHLRGLGYVDDAGSE